MGQGITGIVRPGPKNSMDLCSVGVSLISRVGGFFFVPKGQSTQKAGSCRYHSQSATRTLGMGDFFFFSLLSIEIILVEVRL